MAQKQPPGSRKKYSINWENDKAVSFEVNGVTYESLDEVPGDDDRDKLAAMMDSAEDADFDKKFDEVKDTGVKIENIILGIFTGIAVLMLLIAGISSYSAIQKIAKEESVPGTVVDVIKQREYINEQDRVVRDFYYPVIEYVSKDGKRHSLQLSEGSDSPSYEKGDAVTVLYDPDHPLEARIRSFGSSALLWVLPGITGILGICFLGAVVAVRVVMRSN